ncbi:hypothetical protein M9H77_36739 [Catharanthus roseus]|uniref:Uncharacterized protein n=1 Tax=Catharanthus roseus TaxID=4058 RepID=A0ACB9ZSP1_CATRO|nr:hypothetical protein M9H77_36739 [Catharanthus roseus]
MPSFSQPSANPYINPPISFRQVHSQILGKKIVVLLLLQKEKFLQMSGVWVFKNGVVRLVENPGEYHGQGNRRKMLVHVPSNEVITSYAVLERKLSALGWERYYDDPDLLQFHKRSTVHLISLPKDFNKFKSMHMFDIVVKNRNEFEVRDM